jgi:hypothetical protein
MKLCLGMALALFVVRCPRIAVSRIVARNSEDTFMAQQREPVTVGFDPELLATVKRIAEQEDRSLSQQVRHLVAKALEQQASGAGRAAA